MTEVKPKYSKSPIMDFGKIPPQCLEIEEAVLGVLLIEQKAIYEVSGILSPEIFYKQENQEIYRAIISLQNSGKPIDTLSVVAKLRAMGKIEECGGAYYISELTNRVGGSSSLMAWCQQLYESYMRRELIRIGDEYAQKAYDETEDIFDLYEKQSTEIMEAQTGKDRGNTVELPDLIKSIYEEIDRVNKGEIVTIPSCFKWINKDLGGYRKPEITIVAARPGDGKSMFAIQEAYHMASNNHPVLYFNFDMSDEEVPKRMISMVAGMNYHRVHKCDILPEELPEINAASYKIERLPMYIYGRSCNINEISLLIKKYIIQKKIEIAIIDHFGLIQVPNKNRVSELRQVSNRIKSVCKEVGIPIILLVQIGREYEKGGGRRPRMSDLRETGAVEEDSDKIIFVYRPEKSGEMEIEINNIMVPTKDMAAIYVAKNRQGSLGEQILKFNGKYQRFEDEDDMNLTEETPF